MNTNFQEFNNIDWLNYGGCDKDPIIAQTEKTDNILDHYTYRLDIVIDDFKPYNEEHRVYRLGFNFYDNDTMQVFQRNCQTKQEAIDWVHRMAKLKILTTRKFVNMGFEHWKAW